MKVEKYILFLVSAKFFSLSFHYACFSKSLKLCTWHSRGMQMAQQPGAIYGTKSCLRMITFLTHCPLYSSSHFTQHTPQPKPFQVVLEQNDGFLNFGVEKFYSHCWYFLQPESFLEYEWNILLVENICLKKLN